MPVPDSFLTAAARSEAPRPRKHQRYDPDLDEITQKVSSSAFSLTSTNRTPYFDNLIANSPICPPRPPAAQPLALPAISNSPAVLSISSPVNLDISAPSPQTLEWQVTLGTATAASSSDLAWNLQECHQIVTNAYQDPSYCVPCFIESGERIRHLDVAQRRLACPFFMLEVTKWAQFMMGWELVQLQSVSAYRREFESESYSFCSGCLIEVCRGTEHECFYTNHDQDACVTRTDHDNRWLPRLAFLALRKAHVRAIIAKNLTKEDVEGWTAAQWGAWVCVPYTSHLSRATVVVSLYLKYSP